MAQITYTDKDKTASDGIANKWRDVDANEIKAAVNANHTAIAAAQSAADAAQTSANTKLDKLITSNRQAASYTLVLADAGKLVEMNVAGANNLTVPPNADVAFETGTQILLSQYGAGQTTIVAGVGVTIRSASSALKLTGQYSAATLVNIAADEWYLFGDLTA